MVLGIGNLWANIGIFFVAAVVIGVVGPRLSRTADSVGSATGLGQTLAGALLLGASTSLPGLIVSFQTAFEGRASLAVANSLGGIAAQTLFIALADIALRSDTLEHRDTLVASLLQSAVLISLLTLVLIAILKPDVSVYGVVHPLSLAITVGVVLGFWAIRRTRKHPSWRARHTEDESGGETDGEHNRDENGDYDGIEGRSSPNRNDRRSGDKPDDDRNSESGNGKSRTGDGPPSTTESERGQSDSRNHLYVRYVTYVILVGVSGYLISSAAGTIVSQTRFSPVVMGLTLTALATSLPELVTAIASVRRGAVALAIGDIVGGNAFDTIMVALADVAYARASIYRAVTANAPFVAAVTILMTGILLTGLIRRDRDGLANIGVESYLILAVYLLGTLTVILQASTLLG